MFKLLKKTFLLTSILANFVISAEKPNDWTNKDKREQAHLKYCEIFDFEMIFPGKGEQLRKAVSEEEAMAIVPVEKGKEVGLEQTHLTRFHHLELSEMEGKNVLEIGPATGCFMAKALLSNPLSYTAIEWSELAAKKIPQTLDRYKKHFGDSYPSIQPTVYTGDATSILPDLCKSSKQYDLAILNLSMHYMHPIKALLTINYIKKMLTENGSIMCIVNAPSGYPQAVEVYQQQVQEGKDFPGFMNDKEKRIYQPSTDTGQVFKEFKPLDCNDNIDPKNIREIPFKTQAIGNDVFAIQESEHAFFFFGPETVKKFAAKVDMDIAFVNYTNGSKNEFNQEFDFKKAKTYPIFTCFALSLKEKNKE